jgi:hypothetical protein
MTSQDAAMAALVQSAVAGLRCLRVAAALTRLGDDRAEVVAAAESLTVSISAVEAALARMASATRPLVEVPR